MGATRHHLSAYNVVRYRCNTAYVIPSSKSQLICVNDCVENVYTVIF